MEHVQTGSKSRFALIKWLLLPAVGLLLFGWLINTPQGILGKADAVGYAVCHRIDTRSFHLGERQIPLCMRCSGMYLGAMLGLVYQAVLGRKRAGLPSRRISFVLGLMVLGFAIDGINSYLHLPFFELAPTLYEPSNSLRLITGTGMGLVIAAAIYPAFNQTVWKEWNPKPALSNSLLLLGLIILALILDGLLLLEIPLILYPMALISAGGVLVLLTMIYSMVVIIVFRMERNIQSLSELILPLVAGFGIAMLQIIVLDALRFLFTGTWEGFNLG